MYGRYLHSVVVPGVGPSSGVEKVVRKDEARARRRHSHRPSSAERAVTLRKQCGDFTGMPKPGGNPLLRQKPKVVSFPLPSGLQTTFRRPPRGGPPEVSRCPETVREGENECSEANKAHICWKVGRVASQEQFGSDLGQILTSEGSKTGQSA